MGDRSTGVELAGVDLSVERTVSEFHTRIVDGRWPEKPGEVLVGKKLADELELTAGDKSCVGCEARIAIPESPQANPWSLKGDDWKP